MKFKSAETVREIVRKLQEADSIRAGNRARINATFNGNPPYTDQEARENNIETNVNFLDGTRLMHSARGRYYQAFLQPENYFNVSLDFGPSEKRTQWGSIITKRINKTLKKSRRYTDCLKSQFAGTVLHGIGPAVWVEKDTWCPQARGVADILVPSKTLTSMENLTHFAIYTEFTPHKLERMTSGSTHKGWNMSLVKRIMKNLYAQMQETQASNTSDYYMRPETIEEDFKSNSGQWDSDRVPVIQCYDFYYLDESGDKPCWKRKMIVDPQSQSQYEDESGVAQEYLFNGGDTDYGQDISQIMHVQIGDGAVVPPFRWHSVRSLGFLLYSVIHLQNRLRSRLTDSAFQDLLWLFRSISDGDHERLERVDLFNMGVIPEGLQWVPTQERHQPDMNKIGAIMSMNRQTMSEATAAFTQDVNDGTNKELTATEVLSRVQAANALMSSMLLDAYINSKSQYTEILRRFCTMDVEDCKKFRTDCMADGVPEEAFKKWEDMGVLPEQVIGNGNKMMQMAQSEKLMAVRPMLNPDAQKKVVHLYVEAHTDDPLLASELAPLDEDPISNAVERATLAWGTLIDGQPVIVSYQINRIEYIDTLISMLATEVQRIEQANGVTDQKRAMGVANTFSHIEQQVSVIAGDPHQEEAVKMFTDALTQLSNRIKGIIQRTQQFMEAQAEAAQQQGGQDPEASAKAQAALEKASLDMEIRSQKEEQKRKQKEISFKQDQERKDYETLAEAKRKGALTHAEGEAKKLKAQQ